MSAVHCRFVLNLQDVTQDLVSSAKGNVKLAMCRQVNKNVKQTFFGTVTQTK